MAGIETLKNVILVLCELIVLIIAIIKEKKGWFYAVRKGVPLFFRIKKHLINEWDDVKVEYKDLDDAERGMLNAAFKAGLELPNKKTEQIAEVVWDTSICLEGQIRKIIKLAE